MGARKATSKRQRHSRPTQSFTSRSRTLLGALVGATLVGIVLLAWHLPHDEPISVAPARAAHRDHASSRVTAALALLDALSTSGMHHVGLTVKSVPYGGVGVFVTEPVAAGATVVSLQSSMMLSSGSPSEHAQAALPLALAREHRNSSSSLIAKYMATLPADCPPNLATRDDADQALARLSLQAWKVDLLDKEAQVMRQADDIDPPWSEQEIEWATCTKLSRAFAGVGHGPVMMPLIDLVNHPQPGQTASCVERGTWVDEAQSKWAATLVAQHDLQEGDELTYEYQATPSRARMLTSFGFGNGLPSATIAANGLPQRDADWLAKHHCGAGRLRTELWLQARDEAELHRDGKTRLTEAALRESVRCVRLSLYEAEEAEWALRHEHLDAPWGGSPTLDLSHPEDARIIQVVLQKDYRIVSNTAHLCADALDQSFGDVSLFEARLAAATKDLRDAIAEEATAIASCAEGFSEAAQQVMRRGQALFGWGSSDSEHG